LDSAGVGGSRHLYLPSSGQQRKPHWTMNELDMSGLDDIT